ncbi:hypothetical protein ACCO45_004358 [Purpureocillium lilacinum]|uniref:Uncharacterized protein n=1 Tax=Purpureocillium lilacinum TaxID=33203 RepID=A0ACC4E2H6_PURLI
MLAVCCAGLLIPTSSPHTTASCPGRASRQRRKGSRAARRDGEAADDAVVATAAAAAPSADGRLEPTPRMTGHQWFYIFVLDGLGAMALSGGVNFGIAYGHKGAADTPLRLAQHARRRCGRHHHCAVHHHLVRRVGARRARLESPLRPPHRLGFRSVIVVSVAAAAAVVVFLPIAGSAGDEVDGSDASTPRPDEVVERVRVNSPVAVLQQALRGFLLAVPSFLVLWPISVGALTAVGRKEGADWVYADRWAPQVFKLVLGGVLGLLTTPLMAMFWLVRAGWEAEGGR